MKHKTVDLATEVRRASLPKGLEGFLFPMFEAISNALHSIEDRFGADLVEKGEISITFSSEKETIEVCDNGEGFSPSNLEAFLTPFTGNNFKRKGKGFGRFISFKIFEKVFYASPTVLPDQTDFTSEIFSYTPLRPDDNLTPLKDTSIISRHKHERGLTVSFRSPRSDYQTFFDFTSDEKQSGYIEENLLVAVLDHFLLEFIQEKTPSKFTFDINGAVFSLSEYFDESIKRCGKSITTLEIEEKPQIFSFEYMQINASKAKRHNLYFYADNRATSDLENISKGLRTEAFEDDEGRKYYYLVAVSSDFFKASQSRDRIENLNLKIQTESGLKPIRDVVANAAKTKILELEPAYTQRRRSTMRANVEEIIAFDPMLRRGLGQETIDEFVKNRGITETKEQIASDLFILRRRSKFDFRKINSTTPIEELQNVVRDKIPADAKEALAVYVAYRNSVLKVLREMLERNDGTVAKEDAVHDLVYPRFKDSEEIDYSSHNLWLIDDDLAYAEYVSSDRTPTGKKRLKGEYAHDLLVNSQNELLVVEMKRPQKEKYESEEEATQRTNNPIQQLIDQVDQIREKGRILTSKNRPIEIPDKQMVRGYVLTDWNDKLQKYLKNNDFVQTDFGGPMAYRYYRELNMLIEVLAFDRLADRATKRNEVFSQILEGQSDHSGKKTSRLN